MHRREVLAGSAAILLGSMGGCLGQARELGNHLGLTGPPIDTPDRRPPWMETFLFNENRPLGRVFDYDEHREPAHIEPTPRSSSPGETIDFIFHNEHDEEATLGPISGWTLVKWENGRWYDVPQSGGIIPAAAVEPGGTYPWRLTTIEHDRVVDGDIVQVEYPEDIAESANFSGIVLTEGLYAFGASGRFESNEDDPDLFQAYFAVEADPLPLTPSDDIVDTEWEDDVLVATVDREDSSWTVAHTRVAAYDLEQVEDAPEAQPLVIDHLVRGWGSRPATRDAIALFEEYEPAQVRVLDKTDSDPPFRVDA